MVANVMALQIGCMCHHQTSEGQISLWQKQTVKQTHQSSAGKTWQLFQAPKELYLQL